MKNPRQFSTGYRLAVAGWLALGLAGLTPAARAQQQTPVDTVKVSATTQAVINGALKYLAAQQLPDGSWSGNRNVGTNSWPVAMTSYTLMAFLANGNLPDAGPYARQVRQGLQFLLNSAQADGTFHETDQYHYMYSHGLATMVLSEIYGETQNAAIRTKLQHAVLLIVHGQNPEGGWRYQPGSRDADLSVTVPQIVALCAAKRAGIAVPQVTIDRAVDYLKRCRAEGGGFAYMAGQGGSNFSRTAAAIYALQITGAYDDPMVADGSRYIMKLLMNCNQPDWQVEWLTYGNYYAAVAHYLIGGEVWKNYYHTFAEGYLIGHVTTEGDMNHWETRLDANAKEVGPNWCTAVFTTVLSLPYGYLPLYQR